MQKKLSVTTTTQLLLEVKVKKKKVQNSQNISGS